MDLIFSFDDGSESIAHYGVKGMRWHVRKNRISLADKARLAKYQRLEAKLRRHAAKRNAYNMAATRAQAKFYDSRKGQKYRYNLYKEQTIANKHKETQANLSGSKQNVLDALQKKINKHQKKANAYGRKLGGNTRAVRKIARKATKEEKRIRRIAKKMNRISDKLAGL